MHVQAIMYTCVLYTVYDILMGYYQNIALTCCHETSVTTFATSCQCIPLVPRCSTLSLSLSLSLSLFLYVVSHFAIINFVMK